MATTTTVKIRLTEATKEKLERLAQGTGRSKSLLAADAVSSYVDRELEVVARIQLGIADVAAGRVVPHARVVAEARQILAKAKG